MRVAQALKKMIRVGCYAGPDEARLLLQQESRLAHALASQRAVGLVTDPESIPRGGQPLSFATTSSNYLGSIREPRAKGVSQAGGRTLGVLRRLTGRGSGGFTIDERAGRLLRTGDACVQWSRGRRC